MIVAKPRMKSSDITRLHQLITDGKIGEVENLLKTILHDDHYYDADQNSAASVALKYENYAIYELLISSGIRLGPHEQINVYEDEQPPANKTKLFQRVHYIHRRYLKDPSLKHLQKLISCSKLSHEAQEAERSEHLRCIAEAFEDLNKLGTVRPILEVASTASNLEIAFDFNRDSVEFLDPTKHRGVNGVTYLRSAYICVGAKDLTTKDEQNNVWQRFITSLMQFFMPHGKQNNRSMLLGVLIHELTHLVMQMIYNNDAKPYQKTNSDTMAAFTQIVSTTQSKKDSEPCIKSVYDNYSRQTL